MRHLPEWFGVESAIVRYRESIEAMPTLVAAVGGEVVGFLTVHRHNPDAAEIHVMAARRDFRRRGVGRAMIEAAERDLRDGGVRLLQVKTLAPSREDPNYGQTRAFYRRMGFLPLEENRLWGDANPCLIMVRPLGKSGCAGE